MGSRTKTPLLLAILAPLALLSAPREARAEVVDPARTTLSHLAQEADAIARVRCDASETSGRALVVLEVLHVRTGLPAPATASTSAGVARGAGGAAFAFLSRAEDGAWRLVGGERGLLNGDADALAFARAALEAQGGTKSGSLARLCVASLESPSARVREDAVRALAETPASLADLDQVSRERIRLAAQAALALPDAEPAIALLARLPGDAGAGGLIQAARDGRPANLVGAALRGRPRAIDALLADLSREGGDAIALETRTSVLRTLGHAADRRATPALVKHLDRADARPAALAALTALADPAAVGAVKRFVLGADAMSADLARAAVALAYMGGDEAIGALEHAQVNHPDAAVRSLIADLLRSPAEVRARVESGL